MTSLTLRLQKDLKHGTTIVGAVATLRRVADEMGNEVRGSVRVNVTIPANDEGDGWPVDVKPGRWLVEATLPSGEILIEEVAVPKGQKVSVTLRAAERSPHEWLGWQHLIGNIEGADTFEQIRGRARDMAFSVTAKTLPPELDRTLAGKIADFFGGVADHLRNISPADLPILQEVLEGDHPGKPVVGLPEGFSELRGARAWKEILGLSHNSSTKVCPSAEASLSEALHLYRFLRPARPDHRVFAHVAWGVERFAVSLPVPWPGSLGLAPVEMLVRLHPLEKAVHIGVAVLDSQFGTLAGMMTASTLPQAKIVVEQASSALFGKYRNRLAAAAGGYVLLATGGSENRYWHSWIENLYGKFPDLPDGAVLAASLRLLHPQDKSSYDEARAALFEAFDRGIPYFSAGVARLLDGLTLFAADSAEAKEKMTLVQRVAQRLDLSQAFTVIRLSNKAKRA
jgi:hypothetical protein